MKGILGTIIEDVVRALPMLLVSQIGSTAEDLTGSCGRNVGASMRLTELVLATH